jgi:hypothetical protein
VQLLRAGKVPSPQESSYLKEYLYTLKHHLANHLATAETGQSEPPLLPVPIVDSQSLRVVLFELLQTSLPEKVRAGPMQCHAMRPMSAGVCDVAW